LKLVCGLDLPPQSIHAHPMQIHFSACTSFSALSFPKGQETKNKNVNHCDTSKRDKTSLLNVSFK